MFKVEKQVNLNLIILTISGNFLNNSDRAECIK